MPLEKIKDMTWAEFTLRSFGYWEDVKRENLLYGGIEYQVFCNRMAFNNPFGKSKKPPSKEEYLGIKGSSKKNIKVPEAFKKAREQYLKELSK